MNKAILASLLLTSLTSGVAQANLILNNNFHYSENVNQREAYFINANAAGSDNIFIQSIASDTASFNDGTTFFDGFLSVWQQVGSNWQLIAENNNAPRTGAGDTGGSTIYGQSVLNFVAAQPSSGWADPGLTVSLLANTHYMIVQSAGGATGNNDVPTVSIGQAIAVGTPLSTVFTGKDDLTGGTGEQYSFRNKYTLTVSGNVAQIAAPVAAVPLPGAVWLFGSMLAGFGVMKRKQA